jgi:hypothetical protein
MPSAMNLGRDNRIARRYGSLLDPWGDRPAFPCVALVTHRAPPPGTPLRVKGCRAGPVTGATEITPAPGTRYPLLLGSSPTVTSLLHLCNICQK